MKFAVYVEGKAEMLFVADMLSKYSNYNPQAIGFRCINLNSDDFEYVQYPVQGDERSANYYQIVNVNNDNRVISKLKQDIPNLVKQGYEIIIGLRDVFGADYDTINTKPQVIDRNLVAEMYEIQSRQIQFKEVDTRLHFAIMEYEAWMMALLDKYILSKGRNPEEVFVAAGVDYSSDFEDTVYHPYNKVQKIFQAVNETYGKHESDYHSFLASLAREDYDALRCSGRCASFRSFIDSLLPSGKHSI
ncbi:MAG: hypothetical protein ACI3X9_10030 [Bacteroidaceae bacterium]